MGVAISQARYRKGEDYERAVLKQLLGELNLEEVLIQNEVLLRINLAFLA
ncbi:putative iSMca6/ transposase/ OrfA [Synechococcus sp. A15-127]|nr:putative iSMca6/ transposase/ OrfA [Synechococcus sp. A15-127]